MLTYASLVTEMEGEMMKLLAFSGSANKNSLLHSGVWGGGIIRLWSVGWRYNYLVGHSPLECGVEV